MANPPSRLSKLLGWLGLLLLFVPVGYPLYAIAIGFSGATWITAAITAVWALFLLLALVSIRRRPLISFAMPFLATALYVAYLVI